MLYQFFRDGRVWGGGQGEEVNEYRSEVNLYGNFRLVCS